MKTMSNYQYVPILPMTERDKQEAGSKFWNEGKFENFVAPLLPADCRDLIFVDVGCNAGLFLKLAQDRGFARVIGVEKNGHAVQRARIYRQKVRGRYEIRREFLQKCLDDLPLADVTVLANVHYHLLMGEWLEYLDRLRTKTRICIIVTAKKRDKGPKPMSHPDGVRQYFKEWNETGFVDTLSTEGDPFPRELWALRFESPLLDRISMKDLDHNIFPPRLSFWGEVDREIKVMDTAYFRFLQAHWGQTRWPNEKLQRYLEEKASLYRDIKERGLLQPLIINNQKQIMEGRHRFSIKRHLGKKSVIVREV